MPQFPSSGSVCRLPHAGFPKTNAARRKTPLPRRLPAQSSGQDARDAPRLEINSTHSLIRFKQETVEFFSKIRRIRRYPIRRR